jgi:hypothetical protein
MRSKKPESDDEQFRQIVESQVPGATAGMSHTDLTHLRSLVDPSERPEVAMGLIREMNELLSSGEKRLEQWMAESVATGIPFGSIQEARAYLTAFRALLEKNLARADPEASRRTSRSSE